MTPRIPIGIEDFRELRESDVVYVDKSHLIRELLDEPGIKVALFPRPRRFGKTLNLSMLRCFFEKRSEDLSHLFKDLSIWQAGDVYRAHFQQYPVIHLSFRGTRGASFEVCSGAIRQNIEALFKEHHYLLDSEKLLPGEMRNYRAILDGTAERALYDRALLDLSSYLHRHHGEQALILIDEYDEPIHEGIYRGYAPEVLDFVRSLFVNGLKSNPHLYRAVVTGILHVAKESLFSGANNFSVYSVLSRRFNTCFGFTESEVVSLLDRVGRRDQLDDVRGWYNGYLFGGEVIYNPWSVLQFLHRAGDPPKAYWLSTSSNDLLRDMLQRYALELQPVFESLLEGGSVERPLDEAVTVDELGTERVLWSLLVLSGYLNAQVVPGDPMELPRYRLSIPNREVRAIYTSTFRSWMEARMRSQGGSLDKLTSALLGGDEEGLQEQLQAFVTNLLSVHDAGSLDPESVYQGFVLGLLAVMEPSYRVRSNRESGDGRPDVMIVPREPGKPGAVLELKVVRKGKKSPAAALKEGLSQIEAQGYRAEVSATGARPVHAFAVAFDGKRVWVKCAPEVRQGRAPAKRATRPVKQRRPARR